MKVTVYPAKCVGSGQCVGIAPEVFDQREEDSTVVLLQESPGADLAAVTIEAADVCPAMAIMVEA